MMKAECPLYPRKPTFAVHYPMTALGQKRTLARPFDHFISAQEKRFERYCGFFRFCSSVARRAVWVTRHSLATKRSAVPPSGSS